jgi:hypothetical protein
MRLLAAATLGLHLLWILWVIFGALGTRGRPWLTALHLAAIVWGIVAEVGPWPCPLTLAENWFEAQAGIEPYSGGFLVHYLDAIVYPSVPLWLLEVCAVAVCGANLGIYGWRLVRARRR